MWRRLGGEEETVEVGPGTSVAIPVGTRFQFRSDSDEPLSAIGATMPPWPGEGEAFAVEGPWQPTV
jgi:mannose-6-phosphate isomerase-like protein (cupin superfamily)